MTKLCSLQLHTAVSHLWVISHCFNYVTVSLTHSTNSAQEDIWTWQNYADFKSWVIGTRRWWIVGSARFSEVVTLTHIIIIRNWNNYQQIGFTCIIQLIVIQIYILFKKRDVFFNCNGNTNPQSDFLFKFRYNISFARLIPLPLKNVMRSCLF